VPELYLILVQLPLVLTAVTVWPRCSPPMILLLVLAADRTFTPVVAVTEVSAVAVPAIPEMRPESANAEATTTVLRVVLTGGSVHRSGLRVGPLRTAARPTTAVTTTPDNAGL
jgi:hypothetical protein